MFGLGRRKQKTEVEAETPPVALPPLASAVILAAGAGVAFWWWTQWARGRAESEAVETPTLILAPMAPPQTPCEPTDSAPDPSATQSSKSRRRRKPSDHLESTSAEDAS